MSASAGRSATRRPGRCPIGPTTRSRSRRWSTWTSSTRPTARFVVVGGPDAFMPEYAAELRALSARLGLADVVTFLGDRSDVPRLLAGLDPFARLSRGEGMPPVIA